MSNEKDTIQVKEDTGEVIEDNSYYPGRQGRVIFRNMWSNPFGIKQFDLSNTKEEVFEEFEPFAIDVETGKLLNPSSQPMIVSKGFIDVQERIQSFAKDTDIYAILEKFAVSGDTSLIQAKEAGYGDISEIPSNLNDVAQFLNSRFKALDGMNPELAKMIIDPNAKAEDIEAKANEIYSARLAEYKASQENGKEGAE